MRSPASASAAIARRGGSLAGIVRPSTARDRPLHLARISRRHRSKTVHQPIGAAAHLLEIEWLRGWAVRRPAEEIPLAGTDPELADDVELRRSLDAFGDNQGAPSVREVAERPEDLERGFLVHAALDERHVDLDDVESDLAQQAEAGVARADVVRGKADPGDTTRLDGLAHPADVLDRLPFGELEDDVARVEPVADDHPQQRVDAEPVHLHGPWRQVDRQRPRQTQARRGLHDGVDAREIELAGAPG